MCRSPHVSTHTHDCKGYTTTVAAFAEGKGGKSDLALLAVGGGREKEEERNTHARTHDALTGMAIQQLSQHLQCYIIDDSTTEIVECWRKQRVGSGFKHQHRVLERSNSGSQGNTD